MDHLSYHSSDSFPLKAILPRDENMDEENQRVINMVIRKSNKQPSKLTHL